MPFDDRTPAILRALRGSVDIHEAAIRAAVDRVESLLTLSAAGTGASPGLSLGSFAVDRIDPERFAALEQNRRALDQDERVLLAEARRLLQEHTRMDPRRFIVDVPSGGRLSNAVMHAFAELGRPFGAARVAELLRHGRFDRDEHGDMLHGFPRYRWNRAERLASPPLVVTLDGADLWAGELAQFIDGNQRVVLIVRTPAPPAALVRLITPATLVFQTNHEATAADLLDRFADAPSVGALMPEGCAEFVHAPDAGASVSARLSIDTRPQGSRKPLPGWTGWQQEQELQQLIALSTPPVSVAATPENAVASRADPADRLAAWLLSQADASPARG
jgi:hypothetical protein